MTVQMSDEQLTRLIAALRPQPQQAAQNTNGDPVIAAGAAAVVGQMPPCRLGKDKLKRFKKWKDWIADAETKMTFLSITSDEKKLHFIRSCAGPELTEFWHKEAFIRYKETPADEERGTAAVPAHTYPQVLEETKKVILKLVSRDRAIIDLLRMEQDNRTFLLILPFTHLALYALMPEAKVFRMQGMDIELVLLPLSYLSHLVLYLAS